MYSMLGILHQGACLGSDTVAATIRQSMSTDAFQIVGCEAVPVGLEEFPMAAAMPATANHDTAAFSPTVSVWHGMTQAGSSHEASPLPRDTDTSEVHQPWIPSDSQSKEPQE